MLDTLLSASATSVTPSWLNSPSAISYGIVPVENVVGAPNEPPPRPRRTWIPRAPRSPTMRSGLPSPSRSATWTEFGVDATVRSIRGPNVAPGAMPGRMLTVLASTLVRTRSRTPSPFTSAATTSFGPWAVGTGKRGWSVIGGQVAASAGTAPSRAAPSRAHAVEVMRARDTVPPRGPSRPGGAGNATILHLYTAVTQAGSREKCSAGPARPPARCGKRAGPNEDAARRQPD